LEETLSDFVLDGTGRSEFLYYAEMRLLGVLTLLIPFMKHDAFSGEKEWRIVEHRSPSRPPEEDVEFRIAGNTLVPYIPISLEHPNHPAIPLSSVRLGPRIPPFAKESVEAFLERAGIGRIEGKRVKVDGSSVPFRSLV
jgi:hypothetical protein